MARYTEKEVPDLGLYPAGTFGFKVLSATHSPDSERLKIEVKFEFSVVPDGSEQLMGKKYTERYFLGTDDDPQADLPATKKEGGTGMSWGRYHALVKSVGLYCGDTEEEAAALNATNPDVVADMEKRSYIPKEHGTDEAFRKGPFNGLVRFYAPGKKEPKLAPVQEEGPKRTSSPSSTGSQAAALTGAGSQGAPPASTTEHCGDCDKDIPARLFETHRKKHKVTAVEQE